MLFLQFWNIVFLQYYCPYYTPYNTRFFLCYSLGMILVLTYHRLYLFFNNTHVFSYFYRKYEKQFFFSNIYLKNKYAIIHEFTNDVCASIAPYIVDISFSFLFSFAFSHKTLLHNLWHRTYSMLCEFFIQISLCTINQHRNCWNDKHYFG